MSKYHSSSSQLGMRCYELEELLDPYRLTITQAIRFSN